MSRAATLGPDWRGTIGALARRASGVAVGALLGTVLFSWILEEGRTGNTLGVIGLDHHWTKHDFAGYFGRLIGATGNVSQSGFFAALVTAGMLGTIYALVERWLPGRDWKKGLSFALLPFLLWGLVFGPLVAHRVKPTTDLPDPIYAGFFGVHAGIGTIFSAIVASLAFGIVVARCYTLMRRRSWWEARGQTANVDDLLAPRQERDEERAQELLELSEERPEDGGKRP